MNEKKDTRRSFIKATVGLALAAATAISLPSRALAGKGWCRWDPVVEFDGQSVDVYGDIWTEIGGGNVLRRAWLIEYPAGHTVNVIDDQGEDVFVIPSTGQYPGKFVIRFSFDTNNGDNLGRIVVDPNEAGTFVYDTKTSYGTGSHGSVVYTKTA